MKKFAVPMLESKSDKAYHQWVADYYLKPMPELINAYANLRECWEYYHGPYKVQ